MMSIQRAQQVESEFLAYHHIEANHALWIELEKKEKKKNVI